MTQVHLALIRTASGSLLTVSFTFVASRRLSCGFQVNLSPAVSSWVAQTLNGRTKSVLATVPDSSFRCSAPEGGAALGRRAPRPARASRPAVGSEISKPSLAEPFLVTEQKKCFQTKFFWQTWFAEFCQSSEFLYERHFIAISENRTEWLSTFKSYLFLAWSIITT